MAKQSNKLTAKGVKNLSFDVNGAKKQRHPDGGGLYLLVDESEAKYWRMDYRRPVTQKYNTLAIGTYPTVSLEQARIKRDEFKKMLADGIDPAEQRNNKKREQIETFENIFSKFAEEWLEIRRREGKTDRETIRKLEKDILPFIGKLPVTQLTTEQLERDVTDALVERDALESARRVKSIINMVLKLPLKRRIITYNPAPDISLPQPIKGNHNAEHRRVLEQHIPQNARDEHQIQQLVFIKGFPPGQAVVYRFCFSGQGVGLLSGMRRETAMRGE